MDDSTERYFFGKDRSPEPIVVLNSVLNGPPLPSPNGYLHHWQRFGARRRIENAFDPFMHNFAVTFDSV